ncbi:MAG TPA: 16S rRNA (cytosine(1402)-N(4))-methyltransferase RsmH [Planctomycetota bacterium]|nr:16S rRNA (cytosine(1402)-N(4))-methyltransferase RsmH [Planctomycetota bacterium]
MHRPVLRAEVLGFLAGRDVRLFLDATVGLGGHARAVLEAHPEAGVVGIDRDVEMVMVARERLEEFGTRARVVQAPFSALGRVLGDLGAGAPDAILMDLGVSSPQLDTRERGFSFRADAPLDMRMDRGDPDTAADLVNRLPEAALADLIFTLGDERHSRRIAAAIARERRKEPIRTTGRLADIVRGAVRGRGRIDAATRTFLALRIAVNRELDELREGLDAAAERLAPGGRLLVISFHSGEDRIVKEFFRSDARLAVLTKKVVRPADAEARENPRARSAKMRVAERRKAVA